MQSSILNRISQPLTVFRMIQAAAVIPIARVRLRLRVSLPTSMAKKLKDQIITITLSVESESWDSDWELVSSYPMGT